MRKPCSVDQSARGQAAPPAPTSVCDQVPAARDGDVESRVHAERLEHVAHVVPHGLRLRWSSWRSAGVERPRWSCWRISVWRGVSAGCAGGCGASSCSTNWPKTPIIPAALQRHGLTSTETPAVGVDEHHLRVGHERRSRDLLGEHLACAPRVLGCDHRRELAAANVGSEASLRRGSSSGSRRSGRSCTPGR